MPWVRRPNLQAAKVGAQAVLPLRQKCHSSSPKAAPSGHGGRVRGPLERRDLMQRTIRSVVLAMGLLVLAAGAVQARPLAIRSAPVGFLDGVWQWVLAHVPSWAKSG